VATGEPAAGQPPAPARPAVSDWLRRTLLEGRRRPLWWSAVAVLCGCALIAVTWGVSLERIRYERADAVEDAFRDNSNLALALEEHTIRTLKGVDQTLRYLRHEFQEEGRRFSLSKLTASGVIGDRLFHFLGVVDEHGTVLAGSAAPAGAYLGDRDYFRAQIEPGRGLFVGRPIIGRYDGRPGIPLSLRLERKDGSFAGVVYVGIDPAYFTDLYRMSDLGEAGLITLVRTDGVTLARRAGTLSTFGQDMSGSTLLAEQRRRPIGQFLSLGKIEGVPRFYSYRTLADHGLIVAVGTSQAETLGQFNARARNYHLAASVASALVVAFTAIFLLLLLRQRRSAERALELSARFAATFDQAAVGITLNALDGTYLEVNRTYCAMLGYAEPELLGRTFFDFLHPDERALAAEGIRRLVSDGESFLPPFENRHLRKDGSVLSALVALALVRRADGTPDYMISVVQDITKRKAAEAALGESERRFRDMLANVELVSVMLDRDARITYCNDYLLRLTGWAREDVLGRSWFDVFVPADQDELRGLFARLIADEPEAWHYENDILTRSGERRLIRWNNSVLRSEDGEVIGAASMGEDITERKDAEAALRESREQFEQLANHIPEAFWITDLGRDELVYLSPAYERIRGMRYSSMQAAWRDWKNDIHPEDREHVLAAYHNMGGGRLDEQYRIVRHDGGVRWVHVRGYPVRDAEGGIGRIAGTIEDITERQELHDRLEYQAHYDALTGLPNRVLCYDRLKQALAQAQRRRATVGVLFLDLDRFKIVNDTLGHSCGDRLLREVSERLAKCVRAADTIGRLSGDEFAVILSEIARAEDAASVAQKINETLAEPFLLDGHEVFVTSSIGIAAHPGDGDSADALLKNADAAMFTAKNLGRNGYQFYTAAMNARAMENLQFESKLRRALERREFVLHFQPKVALPGGAITGCEALLRWQDPERGMISPISFIPLLEESGLIVPVGEWVVRAACEQARVWRDAGASVPVAVNLSARQFQHQDVCVMVERALRDTGLDPRLLELEVTESVAMDSAEHTAATMRRLKALGVRVSIDDFGTGYSSLGYLKRFRADYLKLDRSFVTGLPDDADDASISRAVITMAHSLNMKVIAEGVETEAQARFLAACGCDEIQGYLVARALPADEFARWSASRRPDAEARDRSLTAA
jgi:diguanylate cyclase (GGDEF)-like protein/PAS domain S-box-containing protein